MVQKFLTAFLLLLCTYSCTKQVEHNSYYSYKVDKKYLAGDTGTVWLAQKVEVHNDGWSDSLGWVHYIDWSYEPAKAKIIFKSNGYYLCSDTVSQNLNIPSSGFYIPNAAGQFDSIYIDNYNFSSSALKVTRIYNTLLLPKEYLSIESVYMIPYILNRRHVKILFVPLK